MSTTHNVPQGDLVLRTLAMPADTNANGDIFGGWLMSQMDIGGAILAKEIAHGRVVRNDFLTAGCGRRCGVLLCTLCPERDDIGQH